MGSTQSITRLYTETQGFKFAFLCFEIFEHAGKIPVALKKLFLNIQLNAALTWKLNINFWL